MCLEKTVAWLMHWTNSEVEDATSSTSGWPASIKRWLHGSAGRRTPVCRHSHTDWWRFANSSVWVTLGSSAIEDSTFCQLVVFRLYLISLQVSWVSGIFSKIHQLVAALITKGLYVIADFQKQQHHKFVGHDWHNWAHATVPNHCCLSATVALIKKINSWKSPNTLVAPRAQMFFEFSAHW